MEIDERWGSLEDYLKFESVSPKRNQRSDLHAFMLLDELFPSDTDIISAAEHDEIFLEIGSGQIGSLTDEQITELSRCGVRYDSEHECLVMFA